MFIHMVSCSVCKTEIKEKYCPTCGQYYTPRRITNTSLLLYIVNGLYSLDKSFYENIKIGLLNPRRLVQNYWKGYRRYYFSPGKFLTIASLFLLLNFLVQENFFSIEVSSDNLAPNLLFLILFLFFYSFSTWILYVLYKKNYNEHFVMNLYTISLWVILATPISLAVQYFNNEGLENLFMGCFILLICVWNNRVFQMNRWKRVGYVLLNYLLLAGLFYGLVIISN